MTITEALIAEHSAFCAVFDYMEGVLPTLSTLKEVKVLTGQLEGMMVGHSEAEADLALAALDHHREMDDPTQASTGRQKFP